MMRVFNKLKSRKGLTGADVAAAITVIVLTVGIVTGIYINTMNKSKDNMRYANAIRIATGIVEDIQRKTYDEVLAEIGGTSKEVSNDGRLFNTKIISGFSATVSAPSAGTPDIARDITVSVRYKTSTTYKTITLVTVKEKELIDSANAPDLSMLAKADSDYKPSYNEGETKWYYYPIILNTTNSTFTITTFSDINWYNYSTGKCAFILKTQDSSLTVATSATSYTTLLGNIYAWVPRFVKDGSNPVTYLYGASSNKIEFDNASGTTILGYKKGTALVTYPANNAFAENDGYTGVWLQVSKAKLTVGSSGGYASDSIEGKVITLLNPTLP